MLQKVAVVGAGNVGATAAQRLAEKNLARTVVLIDVLEGIPQGKALDQFQSGPIEGFDTPVIGTNGYDEAEAPEVVRRHGRHRAQARDEPRRPRQDQRGHREVGGGADTPGGARHRSSWWYPNPLDVMCYVAMQASGFRASASSAWPVCSTRRATAPSSPRRWTSRWRTSRPWCSAGHGDTMVPLVSYTTVSGIPVSQLLEKSKLDAIVDRARNGGAEIVGPAQERHRPTTPRVLRPCRWCEAIAHDRKRILPCAVWLQGEFGIKDVFCGVPPSSAEGLEQIVDIRLHGRGVQGTATRRPRPSGPPWSRWADEDRECAA
jgi:malate dehydrogenase